MAMIIYVGGTKLGRQRIGWTLTFCPICRAVTPHEVNALQRVDHAYWIEMGKRQQIGQELACTGCWACRGLPLLTVPASAISSEPPDPQSLNRDNYGLSFDRLTKRLALEETALSGGATPEQRRWLLREPIDYLAYMQSMAMRYDRWRSIESVAMVVAGLFLMVAMVFCLDRSSPKGPTAATFAIGAVLCSLSAAVLSFTVWVILNLPRLAGAYTRRLILKSLEPLRPRPDELDAVLGQMPRERTSPARVLRGRDLRKMGQN